VGTGLPGSPPVAADLLTNAASLVHTRLVGLVTAASATPSSILPGLPRCCLVRVECSSGRRLARSRWAGTGLHQRGAESHLVGAGTACASAAGVFVAPAR
jgi:hypothetical protein